MRESTFRRFKRPSSWRVQLSSVNGFNAAADYFENVARLVRTHSVVHDFVVLPPDMEDPDDDARTLVRSELTRIQEFARLSPQRRET